MLRQTAALLIAAALSLGTAASASGADPEATPVQKVSAYTEPSIVYVHTTFSGGVWDRYLKEYVGNKEFAAARGCTGFAITEDGYVGTAAHCVVNDQDAKNAVLSEAYSWAVNNSKLYSVLSPAELKDWAEEYWAVDGERRNLPDRAIKVSWGEAVSEDAEKPFPARLTATQQPAAGDAAILKVETNGLNALPLSDSKDIETGEEVGSIGYPGKVDDIVDIDYTPSIKTGAVSSEKTVGGGLLKVYEIDAPMTQGMSGGPTVNFAGEVVGINSFGPGESESFNFMQPVERLKELVASSGLDIGLSAETKQYRAGLDAYFAGDRAAAVKNLKATVADQPDSQLAKDYLEKAEALPKPKPKEESNTGTVVLVVVLLVVLAAALVIGALYFRRRKQAQPAAAYEPAPDPAEEQAARPIPAGAVCPSCGTQSAGASAFCGNCGAKL